MLFEAGFSPWHWVERKDELWGRSLIELGVSPRSF